MRYTDGQLITRTATHAKGFTGWHDGMYLICVRSNADVPDAFDDKAYLFEVTARKARFIMVSACTTHPGLDVLRNFRTKYNRAGAPVLMADQIVYNSHRFGKHQGKYDAYRQAKGFPYTRDQDGDSKAETFGPVFDNIIWANVHRAGQARTATQIHNWSAGCVVMPDPDKFDSFMTHMKRRPLSLCVLQQF